MRVPSMGPKKPGKSGTRKRGKRKGVRVDKAAVRRFVKRTERAQRAGLLAQAGYVRNVARFDILNKRIAISKKPEFIRGVGYFRTSKSGQRTRIANSAAVSRPGEAPWTYRHKKRGNMFRRIRYGMLGKVMALAGSDFIKREKGSSAATTPSLHEHGGKKSVQRKMVVLHRSTMATPHGRMITPGSRGRAYKRSKSSTKAQRNAMQHAISTGRVQKRTFVKDSYTATYPKRPFMRPAGKRAVKQQGFKNAWVRSVRRALGSY